MPDNVDIER